MRRREFITLLGGAAVIWPLAPRAQQQTERLRRIGVLMAHTESDPESPILGRISAGTPNARVD